MKNLSTLSILFFAVLLLNSSSIRNSKTVPGTEGITFFSGNYQAALAKAKKENKLVFFDAYAVWCRPCLQMKKNTFTDPAVAKYFNEKFVNVMMDMEKGEGIALAEKMDIAYYPTLLFIDGDGNIKSKKVGYLDAEALLAFAKSLK